MKIIKSIVIGLAAMATLGGFTACQDDFDTPDLLANAPKAELTPNTTILEFKQALWQDESNYATQVGTKENGDHYIVSGRVITSDYAGNIYKSLVIQDETSALQFSINAYSLYQKYRIGQEIVIDLTDMYAGKYMGLFQVGAEGHSSSGAVQTSYMSDARFNNSAQLNGFPEPSKVIVHTLPNMSEPAADPIRWQSELVRFNNVTAEPQKSNLNESGTYETVYTWGLYQENFDQTLKVDGTGYTVRTSGYSNFYYELMPTEPFDIKVLLSYYNSDWQFYIIDYADVMNAGNPTIAAGTDKNPWTIDQAIENITTGVTTFGWTKGYIVGTVGPEVTDVTSDSDIEWGAEATLENTVVIAPYPECTDYKQCIIVPLPQGSELRSRVALKNNPGVLGKELAVAGTPDAYMGAFGITGNLGTASEFQLEGVDLSGKGDGTEASPYNCAQVIAMNPSSTTDAVESGIWVHGYIVGYYEDYEAHFSTSTTQRANILISDVQNPTDKAQCVCIQLVAQTDTRNALNLVDNPGNLGAQVSVYGDVMKYNTLPGIKNTSAYKLDGQTGGDTPNPPATGGTPTGSGTAADPYNVAKALEVIAAGPASTDVFVKGKISRITEISTSFGNATYYIVDETGGSELGVYRGYWLNGDKFTSENQLAVGAEVVVTGVLVNYMSNTPQFTTGNHVYSYNGEGAGDTPGGDDPVTPPAPSGDYKGDFDSFNGGEPKSSPYGTYTNATGWTAEGSIILGGVAAGGTEQNPRFTFIGGESTLAVCMNGKTSAPGKIISPTLTGGMSKLTFNYGTAFSTTGSVFSITVKVMQNGATVKEETLTPELTIKTAYSYSMDVNVSGDFSIEIVNNCASGQDKNCDRIAIWNLTWE